MTYISATNDFFERHCFVGLFDLLAMTGNTPLYAPLLGGKLKRRRCVQREAIPDLRLEK